MKLRVLIDEAIHHSLVCRGNQENTARLVNQIAQELVVRKEFSKLVKLMNQLPSEQCQEYPLLCIWHAWALLFQGRLDVVESKLELLNSIEIKQLDSPSLAT